MTEYRELLNRTFKNPTGFCTAVRHNPLGVLHYLVWNGARNLVWSGPRALLDRYREQSARYHRGMLYWLVRAILLLGAMLGAGPLWRAFPKACTVSIHSLLATPGWNSNCRKVLLFVLLFFTSSVAMLLLVRSARYYVCWVPLFYLGVAFCADSLLRAFSLIRYETHFVVLSLVLFCAPNFLSPRPNYRYNAVRNVAALAGKHPTIAASWADPYVFLALEGQVTPLSLWDGIYQAELENGKVGIFVIDEDFRQSKTWAQQRDFFQRFERLPEQYGFKKADVISNGKFDIYYKPRPEQPGQR